MILRLLRRIPRPLAGILVATWIFGSAWALVMPAWDGPDEIQHYSYVETLVEQHALPNQEGGEEPTTAREAVLGPRKADDGPYAASTALRHAMAAINGAPVTVGIARPEQSDVAFEAYGRSAQAQSDTDGGGVFPGSNYPPAYYLLESIGYSLALGDATPIDHLYAARLFSVLFLLATAVGVWLLAGELTGSHRQSQVVATSAVSLWPMLSFVSAMINPDALMFAAWTWAFWMMARIVRRGLTPRRLLALAGLVGLALATKATSLALLPATGFVVLLGLWRARVHLPERRRRWVTPAAIALLILVPVAGYFALSQVTERPLFAQAESVASGGVGNIQEFLSYLWQYYLPRVPGQQVIKFDIPGISGDWSAYNVLVTSGWGAFGWVNVLFPSGVYPWFLGITIAIGVLGLSRLGLVGWRRRRDPRTREVGVPLAVCFGLTFVVLVLGLHITEFKLRSATLQGRYLFPIAALAGLAVVLALRWLPQRARPAGTGATVAALVVFQILSLGYVVGQIYA